jgi:hypothetical protein
MRVWRNHPAYPLKTPEMFEHDPLNVLLAAFAKIAKHGEGAALQIIVSNEGERYNEHYKHILRAMQKGEGERAFRSRGDIDRKKPADSRARNSIATK